MRKLSALLFIILALVLAACGEAAGEGFDAGLKAESPNPPASEQQASQPSQPAAESGQQPQQEPQSQPQQQGDKQAAKAELPAGVTQAKVVRVIDGDTIEVSYIAGAQLPATRVRLIGIDTPESTTQVEPYGKEAAAYTKTQLEGRTIWLEKDVSETDRYGRALRYVWLAEPPDEPTEQDIRSNLFNAILILGGYAQTATYPPDVRYVDYFTKFQGEARNADRGLWGLAAASGSSSRQSSSGSSSGNKPTSPRSNGSSSKTSDSSSASSGGSKCDPNYSGACVPPYPPDVDCGDLSAKGFRVVGTDVHRLDRDKDGIACEKD